MKEVYFPGNFEQLSGETEYELTIPRGDQAIEYAVYCDTEAWLYVHCESVVIPIAHGLSFSGRALVRDAKWLVLRVARKTAIVAVRVASEERRLSDKNSGKPVATHVPAPPALDVLAMARRLVGQREDVPLEGFSAEDLEDLVPDDVDTEFGLGYTQLEEDEDIIDAVQAKRERDKAAKPPEDKPTEGPSGKERGAGKQRRPSDGDEPSKSRATASGDVDAEP